VYIKGSAFSVWKLTDLTNECEHVLTFMLFGDIHKQLWKTAVGTTLGLLNADIMKPSDRVGY
jgi:hypothetical protein